MSTNLATKKPKNNKLLQGLASIFYIGLQSKEEEALEEFFNSVNRAKQEMFDAENFFDNVTDPELIDHAIYKMEAAKSKYTYLLKQARDNNIKIIF